MTDFERESQLYKREGKLAVAGALEAGLVIAALSNPSTALITGAVLVGLEVGRQAVLFEKTAFAGPKSPAPPPEKK